MKYFPILLASILMLSLTSCSKNDEIFIKKSYGTFTVGSGEVSVSDSLIETIEGSMKSDLSFKTSGRIGEITVRPGDTVKKGQLLARLTNQEGIITYNGLGEVIDSIDTMTRTTGIMRNNTVQMRNSTSKLYDERIRQAQNSVKNLEIALEQAKKNLNNQTSTLDSNYHLHANAFQKIADSALYEADKILGITTNFEYTNDGWEPYLGARLGNIKAAAETDWSKVYEARGKILAKSTTTITPENAVKELQILKDAYAALNTMTIDMSAMLENSVIGADLSEDRLNGWVSMWNTFKANEQSAESQFSAWKDAAINLAHSGSGETSVASMDIDTVKTNLENAKKNIDVLKAEKEAKIREINVSISEIDGKDAELTLQFSQTSMNRFLAEDSVQGAAIYAPYDGVILDKYFDIGNMIQAGAPLFQITSNDAPTIKTYIDNYTYAYKKGDTIALENLYSDDSYTGTITLIQDQKDPLHNKNYVEIALDTYSGSLGERVRISLIHKKESRENGVIIPLSAIITRYGPPGVFVLEDGKAKFTLVEMLGSDMYYAEVLGIKKNSIIITDGKENIIDGEML